MVDGVTPQPLLEKEPAKADTEVITTGALVRVWVDRDTVVNTERTDRSLDTDSHARAELQVSWIDVFDIGPRGPAVLENVAS